MKLAFQKFSMPLGGSTPEAWDEGMKIICNDHKTGFLSLDFNYKPADCNVIIIPFPVITGWLSIPLRFESPYVKLFNRM